jgi:hypothetical protein
MMDALGVSSHPCCDDIIAPIDDQKSARRALSAHMGFRFFILTYMYLRETRQKRADGSQ